MDKPNLSVVHTAAATAVEVGSAKEPPRRPDLRPSFKYAVIKKTFKNDWQEQLEKICAFNGETDHLMRYDNYHHDKNNLYHAVRCLNHTSDVEREYAGEAVLVAFWRWRDRCTSQNKYNNHTHRGVSDFHMDGKNLEELVDLAARASKGSALRTALEHDWMKRMVKRDNPRDAEALRKEIADGYARAIPNSYEEHVYFKADVKFKQIDSLHARMAERGMSIVR